MYWYALRSKPNKELTLWQELSARGIECFYPQYHVHPVNPRSRTTLPYFPGYLFVHADMQSLGISAFQWMPFSLGLVSFGSEPAIVPDGLVSSIRRRVDEVNAAGGQQLQGLKRGEPVFIRGGAFDGYEAIFDECLPGNERVRVFLKLLQARQMNLELPAMQIQQKKRR